MKSNQYIAIDLGSSKITALAAEVIDDGSIRILGVEQKASCGIEHGVIESHIAEIAFAVSELCNKLANRAKISKIQQISIAFSAKGMKSRILTAKMDFKKLKTVTEKLVDQLAESCHQTKLEENVIIYDVIPQKYVVDGTETDTPEGKNGRIFSGVYTVVYGDIYIKNQLDKVFQRAGKRIEYNTPASEALSAVLLDDDEREQGCAVIDFGGGNTTLSVYSHGVLQKLLAVPLGGKNITADIAEAGMDEELAEKAKIAFANGADEINLPKSFNRRLLPMIVEARLEEIVQPIINEIKTCNFPLDRGIVLTGGASVPEFMPNYISEKTGLPVRRGSHEEWLDDCSRTERYLAPELSLAVGIIALVNDSRLQFQKSNRFKENFFKKGFKKLQNWTGNQLTLFFTEEEEPAQDENEALEQDDYKTEIE